MDAKISYIIPYKHNIERFLNLNRVLDWLYSIPLDMEVIIVEQLDIESKFKLSDVLNKCRIISVESNSDVFNKSWLMNIGIRNTDSNVLIFGDCDMILSVNNFIESVRLISSNHVVSPYNRVIDLDEKESILTFNDIFKINRVGRGEQDNQKINLCGGITIFRRDALMNIGGWCEDFEGWGCEDDFQTFKVNLFKLIHTECVSNSYHLYHKRSVVDMNLYSKNLNLYNKYLQVDLSTHKRMINNSLKSMGSMNKKSG